MIYLNRGLQNKYQVQNSRKHIFMNEFIEIFPSYYGTDINKHKGIFFSIYQIDFNFKTL